MKTELNPQNSSRAEAFRLWMSSPMPMVTLVKTLDVSRLVEVSRQTGMKFTMLMCWCIGRAASSIEEFFLLPEDGRLFQFDRLAINIVVQNIKGGISLCDVPFSNDIQQFNANYLEQTGQAAKTCMSTALDDYMIVGTSALPQTELDCIVNQYSGRYNNPFLAWGKYRTAAIKQEESELASIPECEQVRPKVKGLFKTTLPVSFQFHHVQMDGSHAACFLMRLQDEINKVLT